MNNKNHICIFWDELEEKKVQCKVCPRYCVINPGKKGFCFVRENIDGELVLTTYGRSSGFCIDPVEKKPLYHFYPGTSILSFGTAGCNLGCKFCQNWDISRSREFDRLCEQATPKAIANTAKKMKCKSVAFTYNDPVIFYEYAIDIAKECRKQDIKTVAVTAGYITEEARADFFEYMDAANVDLKSFSDDFYKRLCSGMIYPVLDTLVYLAKRTNVWLEITNLIIPSENDSEDEIDEMTKWISKELGVHVPLHFSAFHPDFRMNNYNPTPITILKRACEIAKSNGLKYIYTGNVHDVEGSSTTCKKCGEILIKREWYEIIKYNLIEVNHCPKCKEICDGYFDNKAGIGGSKCLPIRIND